MKTVHGIWASSASWDLECALERIEVDYVMADCQHGTWSMHELERLFSRLGAREIGICHPLVRTNLEPGAAEIGHYLDAGAWGVTVPCVPDAASLRPVRRAMRYPPQGIRSLARNVGARNTSVRSLEEYVEWTRTRLTLTSIVESGSALDRLEEIAGASDAILFGLNDLSLDMETDFESCLDAVARAIESCCAEVPYGYLGISTLRQKALGGGIINLGNVKDFIGEAVQRKLRELTHEEDAT